MKDELKQAWEIRNFEIELSWKRTHYFAILVGALFTAYIHIEPNKSVFEKIIIICLGILTSFIWYLSSRGSKFWQENYEYKIDQLEQDEQIKLHSEQLQNIKSHWYNIFDAYPWSVSKINILINFIIFIFWFALLFYNLFFTNISEIHECIKILIVCLMIFSVLIINIMTRSNFCGKKNKCNSYKRIIEIQ